MYQLLDCHGIFYIIVPLKKNNNREFASHLTVQTFEDQKFVLVGQKENKGYIYHGQDYVITYSEHCLFTGDLKTPPLIGEEEYFKVISYDLNHLGHKKRI